MNWDTLCVSCASDFNGEKQAADALKLTTGKPARREFFDSIGQRGMTTAFVFGTNPTKGHSHER